jgi:hypothetical protein
MAIETAIKAAKCSDERFFRDGVNWVEGSFSPRYDERRSDPHGELWHTEEIRHDGGIALRVRGKLH